MGEEWITLAELSERTGVSVEALRKRLARGKLRATRGNDGLVRTLVSPATLDGLRAGVRTASGQPEGRPEESAALRGLEEALGILREQLAAIQAALNDARVDATTERIRSAEERQRLQADIRQLQAELVKVAETRTLAALEAERLKAQAASLEQALDIERKRGWLARLFGRR
jgi:hypothetical protein